MTSVAVIGAGGIGGYLGGALSLLPGLDVAMCVRQEFDELVLESADGVITVTPARIETSPTDVSGADWVLLATKAHQTAGAAPWLKALCSSDTTVVVLQNGIEHVDRVRPFVGDAEILPAIVRYGAERTGPGHVCFRQDGDVLLPDTPAGHAFASLAAGAVIPVLVADDWLSVAWRKLATNVSASAITTLFMVRGNLVGRLAPFRRLATEMIDECASVARAEGADLPVGLASEILDGIAVLPDAVSSSTYQDRVRGRSFEFDALQGAVVRAGGRHGISTPRCVEMLDLLEALSAQQELDASTGS